jgi:spore coat protein A, manganese oxidase
MNSRLTYIVLVILAALFPVLSAFGSHLVDQTWLPGTDIKNLYGQFVDEVPRPGRVNGANELIISQSEFQQKMMPSTFAYPEPFTGTYVWGFGAEEKGPDSFNTFVPSYPGPTVVVQRYPKEDPRSITHILYDNRLVPEQGKDHLLLQEYLTVDQTLHWANPLGNTSMAACMDMDFTDPANSDSPCAQPYLGPVPVTVHLHGAETASAYDGHPDTWWLPGLSSTGPAFVSNNYTYTNTMEPTALWFHDHALGMTRLNIYSGLAAFYLIRGEADTGKPGTGIGLPTGNQEMELLIADRMFDTNGQLLFPDGSLVNNAEYPFGPGGPPPSPELHPYWIPEFFGDVNVVNGKVWPRMSVEPMRYRFRILNGANSRFYHLMLSITGQPDSKNSKGRQPKKPSDEPVFWVIGTDGGLLDRPVPTNDLLIVPSSRFDVIIDFGAYPGYKIELTNDANAPYPDGDFLFNPDTIGKVMRFDVGTHRVVDASFNPAKRNAKLRGPGSGMPRGSFQVNSSKKSPSVLPKIVRLVDGKGNLAKGVTPYKVRQLVLVEVEGPGGPEEVLLNNSKWSGRRFGVGEPIPGGKVNGAVNITELPVVGATEIWEIINLTEDAHPVHIHLGQFQLINRQLLDEEGYIAKYASAFDGGEFIPGYGPPHDYAILNEDGALGGNPALSPYLTGQVLPPEPYEFGWKDVWAMLPGQVTRIAVRIAPQNLAVKAVGPGDNFFAFDPAATLKTIDSFGYPGGPGYVWHCHILDHEDNEMMRPYIPVNLSEDQQ